MNNYFKYLGISLILVISILYTEKINDLLISNNQLFDEIKTNKDDYYIKSVNAEIKDNYIIPGLNGMDVNVFESYNNMKELEVFSSDYLLYNEVKPSISINNNKDKIISKGNSLKNAVSIILEDNNILIDYSSRVNILFSRLVNMSTYDNSSSYEQINNDYNNYKDLERKMKSQSRICVINDNLLELCKSYNKYLIEPSIKIAKNNIGESIKLINSGDIIYVDNNVSLNEYKLILKQIYYKNLKIVNLTTLISEERE